jgi:suppressor for copper-sensitivity B
LVRSWLEISIVFAALGIGLALPYLTVAAFPELVTRLPKPGPWMTTLRRFLGLALAATWVWLLSVLATNIGIIGSMAVGGLTALTAGLFLLGRRAFLGITVAIIIPFFVPGLLDKLPGKNPAKNLVKKSQYSSANESGNLWIDFNESVIQEMVARGKTVFVDVTASWCLTCQVNKLLVLDSKAVLQAFKSQQVVAMQADWTKPNPIISAYLASYGRYGIPFNAIYGPQLPGGIVLHELLSKDAILDAFSRASKPSKIPKKK